jgi:hypothetical protein
VKSYFVIRNKNYTRSAWWGGALEWMYDLDKAIHFDRKIDATRTAEAGVGTGNWTVEEWVQAEGGHQQVIA